MNNGHSVIKIQEKSAVFIEARQELTQNSVIMLGILAELFRKRYQVELLDDVITIRSYSAFNRYINTSKVPISHITYCHFETYFLSGVLDISWDSGNASVSLNIKKKFFPDAYKIISAINRNSAHAY